MRRPATDAVAGREHSGRGSSGSIDEITRPPRERVERACNLQHWSDFPRGGHFAALEEPDLLVEDIRAFFRPLRGQQASGSGRVE